MIKYSSGTLKNRSHDFKEPFSKKRSFEDSKSPGRYHSEILFTVARRTHVLYAILILLLLALILETKHKDAFIKKKLQHFIRTEDQYTRMRPSDHIFGSTESDPVDRFAPFDKMSLLVVTLLLLGFGMLLS